MSRPGIRDVEHRLEQLEPEEPPEGLLTLLKAEIPAELFVHPGLKARAAAPEGRSAGWLGRNSWLAAALLVMTLGGGWLGLQMWRRSLQPGSEAVEAPMTRDQQREEEPATAPGAGGELRDAKDGKERAGADPVFPAVPPPPAASPKVAPPSEKEAGPAVAGIEGGVVGGVEGGVAGGVVGGVPGGVVAPEPAPEDAVDEVTASAEVAPPARLQARAEGKRERAPSAPPAAARAPAVGDDREDSSPLRVGETLEEQRREENDFDDRAKLGVKQITPPSASASKDDLGRFDPARPLAAGGSWRLRASAIPSPLSPGTFWLRVEVRAREGRGTEPVVGQGAELVVAPVSGTVRLRALGGEASGILRQRLAGGGAVAGGARLLSMIGAEPAGGKASVTVVLRYRELDGREKEVGETVDLRGSGRAPASYVEASPEERLLVLAAELARARERPLRRQLLEIARLADDLARQGRGRPWLPRATELAGEARREAALAPR